MRIALALLLVTARGEGPANCPALLQRSRAPSAILPEIQCRHDVYTKGHSFGFNASESFSGSYDTVALQCPLCGDGQGALFGADRTDGLGESVGYTLFLLALANAHSLGFGGILRHHRRPERDPDFLISMSTILGMHYPDLLASDRSSFGFHECVHGCKMSGIHTIVPRSGQAVLWDCEELVELLPWRTVLTGDFLARWRKISKILSAPTAYFKEGPHIALHVRRGDVSMENSRFPEGITQARYRTDDVYLQVVETVQKALPNAQIHVFSTTSLYWNSTSFDRYRSRGYNVHLDGREVDDLAHMVKADVLIAGPSTFSYVAALLNSKCVLKFAAFGDDLPHFISHENGQFSSESLKKLQYCVTKEVKP